MERVKSWYSFDWMLLGTALGIGLMGVFVIAGATHGHSGKSLLWFKQSVWLGMGIAIAAGFHHLNYRRLVRWGPAIYGLTIVLLIVVLFAVKVKGARSWISVPGVPFRIQPSEFAKFGLILLLARYLGRWQGRVSGFLPVVSALALTAIPMMLVLLQPDMGTALVYLPICMSMLFVGGLHPAYFALLASPVLGLLGISESPAILCLWVVAVGAILAWTVLSKVPSGLLLIVLLLNVVCYVGVRSFGEEAWDRAPTHAKKRIMVYLDEEYAQEERKGAAWNAIQAKIAIGQGGFGGMGWGKGSQSALQFLPEVQHDFVFASLGEQWGFLGCTLLLGLFAALFARGAYVAATAADTEGLLLCVGAMAMYATHLIVNTGMVTGLLPITGLPLTFVSYGGAFMLTNLAALGLICSVSFRRSVRIVDDFF